MKFVKIAHGHRPIDVTLNVMALEGAGFFVLTQSTPLIQMFPHHSLAFDGIPIFVPASQAIEAQNLLIALHEGQINSTEFPAAEDVPTRPLKQSSKNVIHVLACLLFGVSAPHRGLFINQITSK